MRETEDVFIVLVTAPDIETARGIAGELLGARLAACVNLVPGVESHYWWNGRIESGAETLLIIKTIAANLSKVEEAVLARHPYETPEVIAFPLEQGNARYLSWLIQECSP